MSAPSTLAHGTSPSHVNGNRWIVRGSMNTNPVGWSGDFVVGASSNTLRIEIDRMFSALSAREFDEEVSMSEAFGLLEVNPRRPGVIILGEDRPSRNARRMRNYYANHAAVLAQRRTYYRENSERQLEHARKYREANRETIREKWRKKYADDPAFRERHKEAARNRKSLHRAGQCASALVGLSGAASAVREDGAKRPVKEDGGVITATPE